MVSFRFSRSLIWVMFHLFFQVEPFLFAFGLVASSICCMTSTRSRSRGRPRDTDESPEHLPPRSPLPRRRRTSSPPPTSTRSILPRRSSQVGYDPFNPLEPPPTVYAEYTHPEIIIAPPPGVTRESDTPQILRSRSLPSR